MQLKPHEPEKEPAVTPETRRAIRLMAYCYGALSLNTLVIYICSSSRSLSTLGLLIVFLMMTVIILRGDRGGRGGVILGAVLGVLLSLLLALTDGLSPYWLILILLLLEAAGCFFLRKKF